MACPLPITLCVHTLNEETNLRSCLESCRGWVSEILVADMGSSDGTLDIAAEFDARVLTLPAEGYADPGRQSAIDACRQPWILVLDADERVTPGLVEAIRGWVCEPDLNGVYIARRNRVFDRWLRGSGFWPDYQLRLLRHGAATWPATVHAPPTVRGRTLHGPAEPQVAIQHLAHPSVEAFLAKTNRYTSLEVNSPGNQAPFRRRGLLRRSLGMAFQSYFPGRGYRDGVEGLWIAILMGMYGLEVELKRWERSVRQAEISSENSAPNGRRGRPEAPR